MCQNCQADNRLALLPVLPGMSSEVFGTGYGGVGQTQLTATRAPATVRGSGETRWGRGAVGSAFEWHSKGRGFESRRLHFFQMKKLLAVTAVIEAGAGLALLVSPSTVTLLLLDTSVDTPTELTISRIAGAALLALGIACWLARGDDRGRAATGLIIAMLVYNSAAVALLVYAGLGFGLFGVGFWPAVGVHLALLVWCVACIRTKGVDRVM